MTLKIRTKALKKTSDDGTKAAPVSGDLMAFSAEGEPRMSHDRPRLHWATAAGLVLVVLLAAVGVYVLVRDAWLPLRADTLRPARLTVYTQPSGAELLIDGVSRGTTPATLALAAGLHRITLRRGTAERTLPVTLSAGADVAHYLDLGSSEPVPARNGKLSIVTDPPGARVQLDGEPRGTSPLLLDVAPAEHKVSVTSEAGSAERTVAVDAGGTASVLFSLPKVAAPLAGWIAIASPIDVQVIEGDGVVAVGKASKVMMPAGRHEVTIVNDSLGFREKRIVEVGTGKTTAVRIDPPRRSININARPWADVIIDGASVGQTPIANVVLPIGPHEIVFRHPQLGERRETKLITVPGPNRIAVDMIK
jgi:hypothetical protein